MLFTKFERKTAFRYLRSKKERTFSIITGFSLAGITIGVASIIIVMSVMNGFREELVSKILGIGGHTTIRSYYSYSIPNVDDVVATIKNAEVVKNELVRVQPTVESQVIFSNNGQTVGGIVKGVDYDLLMQEKLISGGYVGKPIAEVGANEVIVGYAMAQRLKVRIGDSITFISPQGNITAFGTFPKIQSFVIAGTFNIGMFQYDSSMVFMKFNDAQAFFNKKPGEADYIELFLKDPDAVDSITPALASYMGDSYLVNSWKENNATYYGALKTERNVMFLILTLIIIVASFNIISSLTMMVKDKGGDIAVFRTIGASKRSITKIFFLSGATIGVVGTFVGVFFGTIIAYNLNYLKGVVERLTGTHLFAKEVYFLSQLPSKVYISDIVWIAFVSLGISFIATIIPARSAAKTDPVEALRYE